MLLRLLPHVEERNFIFRREFFFYAFDLGRRAGNCSLFFINFITCLRLELEKFLSLIFFLLLPLLCRTASEKFLNFNSLNFPLDFLMTLFDSTHNVSISISISRVYQWHFEVITRVFSNHLLFIFWGRKENFCGVLI